jgi:hypothetical protein
MIGWRSAAFGSGHGESPVVRRADNMAHRKGLCSRRVTAMLMVFLLIALLLGGRVLVLNQMTVMRTNISVLEDRQGFLETRAASLLAQWNRATSAAVIRARAEKELGLVLSAEPGLVLVRTPDARDRNGWSLPAWLGNLAAGQEVQAAAPPTIVSDMISLQPRPRGESPGLVSTP